MKWKRDDVLGNAEYYSDPYRIRRVGHGWRLSVAGVDKQRFCTLREAKRRAADLQEMSGGIDGND